LFRWRRVGAAAEGGRFQYIPDDHEDYRSATEAGVVSVVPMAPGDYEVFAIEILFEVGLSKTTYRPRVPVVIPFTLRAGEVVYLGNFQANRLTGSGLLGIGVPAGAVFVVEDRESADLAIARRVDSRLGTKVTNLTSAVLGIGHPNLVARRSGP
jgi:hypothetical protein